MGGRNIGAVALISNDKEFADLLKARFRGEGYEVYCFEQAMLDNIERCSLMKVDIIVNLFKKTDESDYINRFYESCQIEGDYYINNNRRGHIVNGFYGYSDDDTDVACIKGLTEGLGVAFGNHGVIVNGVISNDKVDEDIFLSWILYCSSKYGDILASTVLNLHDNTERIYLPDTL